MKRFARIFVGGPMLIWAITLLFSAGAMAESKKITGKVPKQPHQVSSGVCQECHKEIYEQWSGSMHANSTALKDPIHGGFYRFVIGDPTQEGVKTKKGQYPVCLKCHVPAAAIDKKTKLDAMPAYEQGVNCISCHTIKKFKGVTGPDGKNRYGIDAYELSSTGLQAPSGRDYSTKPVDPKTATPATMPFHPFPMEGNSIHKTNAVCMGCHDKRENFKGAPLCVTGDEYNQVSSFVACQSCHMPKVKHKTAEGGTIELSDHSMAGGHSEGQVAQAMVMDMTAEKAGDTIKATVSMHNRLPHAFPTGAPFRNFYLKISAYDGAGKQVWQNYKKHPMKEDPKSMFVKVLGDDTNKPVPPPKATKVLKDTRLQPNERREVQYDIPAAGVKLVRAEALYNLILPPQIKMLGDALTPDLKAPKLAGQAEVRL